MADHPFALGPTSAVEPGPWHYGADYVACYFEGDASSLGRLLPSPFVVDGGDGIAYVCQIVSVGESGADMVSKRPDRTVYEEAAVGIRCRFGDRRGIFYPVMWVTTEWSLLRGILNGYQKRLADRISLTRLHPLNPGLKAVSSGTEFGGFCVKGPETTLSVSVRVERAGAPSELPAFGTTFGMRMFPRTDESQGAVDEPVEILKSNSRVSDVWLGTGSIQTTLGLGPIKPLGGAVYRSGFTILGARALR